MDTTVLFSSKQSLIQQNCSNALVSVAPSPTQLPKVVSSDLNHTHLTVDVSSIKVNFN